MMRGGWRTGVGVWLMVFLGAPGLLSGQVVPATADSADTGEVESVAAGVDAVFADLVSDTFPGCAVSVMQEGEPVYEQGYGMANLEYGVPITPHSVFHVASVSKHFTAMAIELLVNEGRVSWDDDIRDHVPEVPDFGTPITLRQLVHHVSGIRDQWALLLMAGWRWEADVVTQKDVLDITSRQTALNYAPGERYLYSNTGFTLLAVVVERVTGQTLREFTTERIFGPLGMEATHFHDDHQMIVRDRAWAYAPQTDGEFGLKNSIPDFDVVGATSLFTTAHEMAAWDRNFYTGEVGGAEAIDRLRQPYTLNDGEESAYGHGWSVGSYRGLPTEGHGGADAGYRSNYLRFPDQDLGVAVLCNFPTADPGSRARRVAEAYLEEEMEPAPEDDAEDEAEPAGIPDPTVEISDTEAEAIVGVYRGAGPTQLIRVVRTRRGLRVVGGGITARMRPLGDGRFEAVGQGAIVTAGLDGDGVRTLDTPGGLLRRIADMWEPAPADLEEFAGTYRSEDVGTEYVLILESGTLRRHHRKMTTGDMRARFRDGFSGPDGLYEFTRDADGRVDGFRLSTGRVWNVRFDRMRE